MGAGLFLRTLMNLRNVDLGFLPERLIVLNVNPQAAGYKGETAVAVTTDCWNVSGRCRASRPPATRRTVCCSDETAAPNLIRPEGFPAADSYPRARWDVVGPAYFSTMGIRLVAGRDFTEQDNESSPRVIAINETMAQRLFPGAEPIGRRLVWGDTT